MYTMLRDSNQTAAKMSVVRWMYFLLWITSNAVLKIIVFTAWCYVEHGIATAWRRSVCQWHWGIMVI